MVIDGGFGITYWDIESGRAGWKDIWKCYDMLTLRGWREWENHAAMERVRQK